LNTGRPVSIIVNILANGERQIRYAAGSNTAAFSKKGRLTGAFRI